MQSSSPKFWFRLAAIFTLAARSKQTGENVTFAEQPYPGNIYAYVGVALTIPCRATSGGPSPRNISTNLVLNSAPFDVYFPPDRYGAETDNNGTIIGFVINGVMEQDSGATFSCTVGTLSSTAGTLVVRDGTPGAVQGLAQVNQPSLYCVTVGWSGAPFPPNGPILLYTVTLTTEMGVVQATYNVSAEDVMQCTLCGLLPDTSYSVAMVALNNYGYGDPSSNITVRTATPIDILYPSATLAATSAMMSQATPLTSILLSSAIMLPSAIPSTSANPSTSATSSTSAIPSTSANLSTLDSPFSPLIIIPIVIIPIVIIVIQGVVITVLIVTCIMYRRKNNVMSSLQLNSNHPAASSNSPSLDKEESAA